MASARAADPFTLCFGQRFLNLSLHLVFDLLNQDTKLMKKQKILIAGGSGLVGTALVAALDKSKYDITILSRSARQSTTEGISFASWDTTAGTIDYNDIPDHVINLAGAGIADARWTDARKRELINSRVDAAATLESFFKLKNIKPKTYISASAVGYYGDSGDRLLDESSSPGSEFMSECCIAWENAATAAGRYADRSVIIRISLVLTTLGGALPKMLMTKVLGIYNYFGNGEQYYAWTHIDDLCRLFVYAIENDNMKDTYNNVAPQQITNKAMMQDIKTQLGGLAVLSAPAFALRIMLGEMANVVLNSNRAISTRIQNTGFQYNYTDAGLAVKDCVDRKV